METIILWFVLSFVIAHFGADRKIGRGWTLLICLIFSPLIGLIILLLSEKKVNTKGIHSDLNVDHNFIQELKGLADLRDRKVINEYEYQLKKSKIMEDWDKIDE